MKMVLTDEQLLECYDLVFDKVHSDGFKLAEIKDILVDRDYVFTETPLPNWRNKLEAYLCDLNFTPGDKLF